LLQPLFPVFLFSGTKKPNSEYNLLL
jgi:hypothetical protein